MRSLLRLDGRQASGHAVRRDAKRSSPRGPEGHATSATHPELVPRPSRHGRSPVIRRGVRGRARVRRRDHQREGHLRRSRPHEEDHPDQGQGDRAATSARSRRSSSAPDKGVQDAVVYLKDVEKGKAWQKPAEASPEIVNKKCSFDPARPGDPGRDDRDRQLRPGPAQHARLPRQADRLQRGPADQGPAHREAAQEAGHRPGGVRRPRLDARRGSTSPTTPTTRSREGRHVHASRTCRPGSYTLVAWQEYTGRDRGPGDREAEGDGAGHRSS